MKFYWKEKILLCLYADWMGRTHHEYGSISTEVFLANNTKAYLHLMCAFTSYISLQRQVKQKY